MPLIGIVDQERFVENSNRVAFGNDANGENRPGRTAFFEAC